MGTSADRPAAALDHGDRDGSGGELQVSQTSFNGVIENAGSAKLPTKIVPEGGLS